MEFDLPLVGAWLELMRPVYDQMADKYETIDLDEMGRRSVVHSLNNLLTFPFIAEADIIVFVNDPTGTHVAGRKKLPNWQKAMLNN